MSPQSSPAASPCTPAVPASKSPCLTSEPVGRGADGEDVYLADLWPSAADVQEVITASVRGDLFRETYGFAPSTMNARSST